MAAFLFVARLTSCVWAVLGPAVVAAKTTKGNHPPRADVDERMPLCAV
jgi:hypothetical protein